MTYSLYDMYIDQNDYVFVSPNKGPTYVKSLYLTGSSNFIWKR